MCGTTASTRRDGIRARACRAPWPSRFGLARAFVRLLTLGTGERSLAHATLLPTPTFPHAPQRLGHPPGQGAGVPGPKNRVGRCPAAVFACRSFAVGYPRNLLGYSRIHLGRQWRRHSYPRLFIGDAPRSPVLPRLVLGYPSKPVGYPTTPLGNQYSGDSRPRMPVGSESQGAIRLCASRHRRPGAATTFGRRSRRWTTSVGCGGVHTALLATCSLWDWSYVKANAPATRSTMRVAGVDVILLGGDGCPRPQAPNLALVQECLHVHAADLVG
jgi:hypothetical protein